MMEKVLCVGLLILGLVQSLQLKGQRRPLAFNPLQNNLQRAFWGLFPQFLVVLFQNSLLRLAGNDKNTICSSKRLTNLENCMISQSEVVSHRLEVQLRGDFL